MTAHVLPSNFIRIEDLDGNELLLNPDHICGAVFHSLYTRGEGTFPGKVYISFLHDITEIILPDGRVILTKARFKIEKV